MDVSKLKIQAQKAIDEASAGLREVSLSIHGKPELNFEEHHAHAVLTEYLEARKFHVERGAYGMPTAFKAVAGSGSPTIAVLCEYDALNDVVFSRGDLARVVRISAHLDSGYLAQYTCDGLIVSTATGSTGYALAVSGPILPPELRNMLLIPIAPHLSMDRAVVLSEGTVVRLRA